MLVMGVFYSYDIFAQSIVFNNVFNDYSYTKTSPLGEVVYNLDYLHHVSENNNSAYSIYGYSSSNYQFNWEDSIYVVSYIVDINNYGDTIKTTRIDTKPYNVEAIVSTVNVNNKVYAVGVTSDTLFNNLDSVNGLFMIIDENNQYISHNQFNLGEDNNFSTIKTKDNGQSFQVLGFADVDTAGINYDAFISTIDSSGNLINNIQLGGTVNDFLYGLVYLDNGNYLVCGHTFSFGVLGSDIWLLEVEPNGTVVWQKFYGGQYYERIWNSRGMVVKDNYIYIAGTGIGEYTHNGITEPTGAGWLLKLDMQGNEIWNKKYIRGLGIDYFLGIQEWDNETFIIGGEIQDYTVGDVAPRGWIMKVDTSGKILWERVIAKYDASDNNGNDPQHYVYDVLVTQDKGILLGGYIIANYITDIYGYFHRNDAWLAKTDSCGFTVGDVPEPMLLIDSIYNRTVYISEQSTNYCSGVIDWGDGTAYFYSAYENNKPLSNKSISHTYNEIDNYIIRTTTVAGEETRDFELQVLGLSVSGSVIPAQLGITLFPNPANDYVIVENRDSFLQRIRKYSDDGVFSMHILDLNGKQVKSINLNAKLYQQKVDVSGLNNGVYFVKFMFSDVLIGTEKLVIAR